MRTSIIPAQITTVEDKIAGNLNLTQIVLLLVALLVGTAIFAIVPPTLKLAFYKIPMIIIVCSIFLLLALRVKGKVVVEWLIVLLKYNLRPTYYLYNKNTTYLRDVVLPEKPKHTTTYLTKHSKNVAKQQKQVKIADLIKIQKLLTNPGYQLSFKIGKEGGFNVDVAKVQK